MNSEVKFKVRDAVLLILLSMMLIGSVILMIAGSMDPHILHKLHLVFR